MSHPLRRVLGELPPAHRTLNRGSSPHRRWREGTGEAVRRPSGRRVRGHARQRVLRDRGAARHVEPRAAVPRTVQDVVLARFARLAAPCRPCCSWSRSSRAGPNAGSSTNCSRRRWPTRRRRSRAGCCLAEGARLSATDTNSGGSPSSSSLSAPLALDLHQRVLAALANPARGTPPARAGPPRGVAAHDARERSRARACRPRARRRPEPPTGRPCAQWRSRIALGAGRQDAAERWTGWRTSPAIAHSRLERRKPRRMEGAQFLPAPRGDIGQGRPLHAPSRPGR